MTESEQIDFGDDSGVPPSEDAHFDAWIARVAPTLNAPTATPRADMWDAIQAANRTSLDAQAGVIPGVTPLRRHWRLLSVIAAALVIGIAIDRFALGRSAERRLASAPDAAAPGRPTVDASAPSAKLYRIAAAQTLTQAEALLVAYRASDPQPDSASLKQLGGWGREVLTSTRLLLDSPAGGDPQLRPLLDDLELVLVQIVRLSGAPMDTTDRALIDHALQERKLLPRIRTAMPAPAANASSD
ncbi:MAG TPA: hypothetical protein VJ867_00755 [Gemmatimonadaceae bacterium]|nr:hypothetical protein [Gemmatimonadaceae bacterium]